LVDDGVDGDGRLTGLAVANDQLALAAADRDHAVNRLDAGLHGLLDGLPFDDAGSDAFHGKALFGFDRALAVNGASEGVDSTPDERLAHGHRDDAAGAADFVAFLQVGVFAEQHSADLILFEVHGDAGDVVGKLKHFP